MTFLHLKDIKLSLIMKPGSANSNRHAAKMGVRFNETKVTF
jgi:hypothetical protein